MLSTSSAAVASMSAIWSLVAPAPMHHEARAMISSRKSWSSVELGSAAFGRFSSPVAAASPTRPAMPLCSVSAWLPTFHSLSVSGPEMSWASQSTPSHREVTTSSVPSTVTTISCPLSPIESTAAPFFSMKS